MFKFPTRPSARPDSHASPPPAPDARPDGAQVAMFAAGCFWGVEAADREIEGVLETRVGYTGGRTPDPSYEQVCAQATATPRRSRCGSTPRGSAATSSCRRFGAFTIRRPAPVRLGRRKPVPLSDLRPRRASGGAGGGVKRSRATGHGAANSDRDHSGWPVLRDRGVPPAVLRKARPSRPCPQLPGGGRLPVLKRQIRLKERA
jgi:Peptide methionine sulfoxide reductase